MQACKSPTFSTSYTLRETRTVNERNAISNMRQTALFSTCWAFIFGHMHPDGYLYRDVHVREASKRPWHIPMENYTISFSIHYHPITEYSYGAERMVQLILKHEPTQTGRTKNNRDVAAVVLYLPLTEDR